MSVPFHFTEVLENQRRVWVQKWGWRAVIGKKPKTEERIKVSPNLRDSQIPPNFAPSALSMWDHINLGV